MKNYKQTLFLPKTSFAMKANLVFKEQEIQKFWIKINLVQSLEEKNKNKQSFFVFDGPPFANGNIHIGHALNKILKDFIVRFYSSQNYYTPFICGWDTHGLPVENKIIKKNYHLKHNKALIRKLASEYVIKQINLQKQQFQRLGLLTNFNNFYYSDEFEYVKMQLKFIYLLFQKKLIYQATKPIYWSYSSQSALADSEIEYQMIDTLSIYVNFRLKNDCLQLNLQKDDAFVIWTTTPWSLIANQLVAINENIKYCLIIFNNTRVIVAKINLEKFLSDLKITNFQILKQFMGKELLNLVLIHPLLNKEVFVVHGYHVNVENKVTGTGIVHIAPCFGIEDYQVGILNQITKIISPLNKYAKFKEDYFQLKLKNVFYLDANKIIIDQLIKNNNLLKSKHILHKYPIDWRTKKPVIYLALKQWFIKMSNLKTKIKNNIDLITFKQKWAKKHLKEMIDSRTDWCISRQRSWGVPLIVFYDSKMQVYLNQEIFDFVMNVLQEKGINFWFEADCNDLLPLKYHHLNLQKEKDIIDVWFDSALASYYVKQKFNFNFDVDLFLEGNDQFRGWFNASLIVSTLLNHKKITNEILTHGFVNDENNLKMSKSIGNILTPQKVINLIGADGLRLWVCLSNYQADLKISQLFLNQVKENYLKIRNIIRFILGNLHNFDYDQDKIKYQNLNLIDRFILSKFGQYYNQALKEFQNYNFNGYFLKINYFIINYLSKFYFDFSKDVLYINLKNNLRKLQIQTTFFILVKNLLNLLKFVLVHTCEEAYLHLQFKDKKSSIHFEAITDLDFKILENNLNLCQKLLELRNNLNKEIEILKQKKIIKKSLECILIIHFNPTFINLKYFSKQELATILMVSEVDYIFNDALLSYQLELKKSTNQKCLRCWQLRKLNLTTYLCNSCQIIIQKLNENKKRS